MLLRSISLRRVVISSPKACLKSSFSAEMYMNYQDFKLKSQSIHEPVFWHNQESTNARAARIGEHPPPPA